MRKLYVLFFLVISIGLLSAQTQRTVKPSVVDPASGAPDYNHYIYLPDSSPKNEKLFLFFPGTNAVPFNYRLVLEHAASLGYHSIGLCYPNTSAINSICGRTTDTTCHSRARLEVFDGKDRNDSISVDSVNSIRTRTLNLLKYLDNNFPAEGWSRFYTGDSIVWEHIILSGHSQGGGHAGILSKLHRVERVVMFAAMDWIGLLGRNADWITWAGKTPEDRYYGFTHEQDEKVNFTRQLTTWSNYGMASYGAEVLVDTTSTPFDGSRMLFTRETPANDTSKFHGSMVADPYTPMNGNDPLFADVWTYLIDYKQPITGNSQPVKHDELSVYPNPNEGWFNIELPASFSLDGLNIQVYEITGKLVYSEITQSRKTEVRLDVDASGLYLVRCISQEGILQKRVLVRQQ